MRVKSVLLSVALALAGVLAFATPAWAHPVLHIAASPTTVVAGSSTTLTISGTSNGNYTGARIDVSSSGGPGTLTSFTTLASCGGGPTCTEAGSVYRLALPTLTNGENFSYTITLNIDATTTATSFTSIAQFFKSDNTTDGPTTGPVITITNPHADLGLALTVGDFAEGLGEEDFDVTATNHGPDALTSGTYTITASPADLVVNIETGCSGTGASVVCTVPALASGASSAEGFLDLDPSLLGLFGSFTVTATRTASSPADPNPANDTASITCSVTLDLEITCP